MQQLTVLDCCTSPVIIINSVIVTTQQFNRQMNDDHRISTPPPLFFSSAPTRPCYHTLTKCNSIQVSTCGPSQLWISSSSIENACDRRNVSPVSLSLGPHAQRRTFARRRNNSSLEIIIPAAQPVIWNQIFKIRKKIIRRSTIALLTTGSLWAKLQPRTSF